MDREKELKEIFNDDPYELLKIKPKSSNQRTSDDRLIVSFEDINNFYEENQEEPQANQNDIMEHIIPSSSKRPAKLKNKRKPNNRDVAQAIS